MGLDMYLERMPRGAQVFKDLDPDEMRVNSPDTYQQMRPYLRTRGSEHFHWESLYVEAGYWRKANQIHNWFVENVQDGEDDCGRYEVTKEQLEELRDICIQVATQTVMVAGKVKNGYHFNGTGAMVPCMEPGKVIVNPEIAEELLPTQGGFFFSTALAETDFATQVVFYSSSW